MRVVNKIIDGDIENLKDYKLWNVFYINSKDQTIKVDDTLYKLKEAEEMCHIVLDNTAGSGTTGEACINTNREFILIEKGEEEFNTIINRLNDAINKYSEAMKLAKGITPEK